jgi:hypothetical protein
MFMFFVLGEACSGKSTFLDKLMFLTEQTSVLSPSYKLELSSDGTFSLGPMMTLPLFGLFFLVFATHIVVDNYVL